MRRHLIVVPALHGFFPSYAWTCAQLDCLELAASAREIDMRASPYDLSGYGFTPIAVEHAARRAEYVRCQKAIAARAEPLRAALLARCDLLLGVAGGEELCCWPVRWQVFSIGKSGGKDD